MAFCNASLSNSLVPTKSTPAIVGRSSTTTTQDVAIGFEADVFKKPQGKQRANRCGPLVVVVFIANTQRHGARTRCTCFDTLQAFDADVLDLERLESPSPLGQTEQRSNRRGSARAKSIKREFHVRSRRQH